MEKFFRFIKGYVGVLVTGAQCERFLNLCRGRGIVIEKLKKTSDEQISGILSLEDFRKLRPLRRKTDVHICVTKKYGLPFFFFRSKKRKAFFAGVLLCLLLLCVCSMRIWNIHIEGNQIYSTPQLLALLESEGIVHGMAKSQVQCSKIAARVREHCPRITWVSARIEGTRLILTVQEGKPLKDKEATKQTPCSLRAGVEGKIVRIITRAGVPKVRPGDSCKKGDLLVLGRLDLKNDSQEVVRYEYVAADADIYVARTLSYYQEFPMTYTKRIPEGDEKKRMYFRFGRWRLGGLPVRKEGWNCIVEETPLKLTENFRLPISVGRILQKKQKTLRAVYTEKEAKAIAEEQLHLYEQNLIEKGVQISRNNVKIEINHETCVSRGTLDIIEQTGVKTPVEYVEQPTERTAQDGQQHY